MTTVGEIERYIERGNTMACAKCGEQVGPGTAMSVYMTLDVRVLGSYERRESVGVALTPLCQDCVAALVPSDGQEVKI